MTDEEILKVVQAHKDGKQIQCRSMTESEKNKRIKDLLYLNRVITDIITNEIEECVMRGRPSSDEEIKDHIVYHVDDRLRL